MPTVQVQILCLINDKQPFKKSQSNYNEQLQVYNTISYQKRNYSNMGCSASINSNVVFDKRRRSSVATVSSVDALESNQGHFGTIKKRYGHPSYFKMDGYDLGLRYKV